MGFDTHCLDLAEFFLLDEPALDTEENKAELAQSIQNAVEDWFKDREPVDCPPSPDGTHCLNFTHTGAYQCVYCKHTIIGERA